MISQKTRCTRMANNLIYQYFLPYTGNNRDIIGNGVDLPKWAEIGKASAKRYAEAIGAQYEFCDEWKMHAPNQNLESCRVWMDEYFDQFDKVLLLDVDTIIKTRLDIFKEEIADIGMVHEGGVASPKSYINNTIARIESYGDITLPKSKTIPHEKRYLNGGVQLWSKEGRLKARERFGGMPEIERYRETLRLNEQPYINLMLALHDMEVTELDNLWNRMSYMWTFGTPDGRINHFLHTTKRLMNEY